MNETQRMTRKRQGDANRKERKKERKKENPKSKAKGQREKRTQQEKEWRKKCGRKNSPSICNVEQILSWGKIEIKIENRSPNNEMPNNYKT
jgi:hypothetical protein